MSSFPLASGVQGRSAGTGGSNHSILGVVIDAYRQNTGGDSIQALSNATFSRFDNACKVAAAVGVGTFRSNYWNSGNSVEVLSACLRPPTVQYSTVPYGTTWCSTVQYSTVVRTRTLRSDYWNSGNSVEVLSTYLVPPTEQSSRVLYCTVQCGTVRYNTAQYSTVVRTRAFGSNQWNSGNNPLSTGSHPTVLKHSCCGCCWCHWLCSGIEILKHDQDQPSLPLPTTP